MPLPSEAKYFADLNAATTEADTHLLALQQGSPPVGGATPTPTRKWTLLALRTWLQGFFVRGPASVTSDRIALFDGATGRLLKQAGGSIGPGLTQVPTGQDLEARLASSVTAGALGITRSNPLSVLGLTESTGYINEVFLFSSLPAGNKWHGGVLAPNGKIYGIPRNSTTVLEIDPGLNGPHTWALSQYVNKL